jgi:hypothetical protein
MTKEEEYEVNLYVRKLKEQRVYFQYTDVATNLLESQKDTDLLLLQESFTNWIGALKEGDKRKDELTLLLISIWRIQAYCVNIETVSKAAVVDVMDKNSYIKSLESQIKNDKLKNDLLIKSLESQIKMLKDEIDFNKS